MYTNETKGPGCISKTLALIFAGIFIVTALISLLLFNLQAQLFRPTFYKSALQEQDLYDKLPGLVFDQVLYTLSSNTCGDNASDCKPVKPAQANQNYFGNLTQQQWQQLLSSLMPPDWLKAQTEEAIDQTLAYYLKPGTTSNEIQISLSEVKGQLASTAGEQAVLKIIDAQPACSEQQIAKAFQQLLLGTLGNQLPLCKPPELILQQLDPLIKMSLTTLAADLPDEATMPVPGSDSAQDYRPALRTSRTLMALSPLLALGSLLLVTIFGVRSLRGWMRWWGIPLLMAGVGGLIMAFSAAPLIDWSLHFILAGGFIPGQMLSPDTNSLLLGLGHSMSRTIATWIGGEAVIMAILGALMGVLSLL